MPLRSYLRRFHIGWARIRRERTKLSLGENLSLHGTAAAYDDCSTPREGIFDFYQVINRQFFASRPPIVEHAVKVREISMNNRNECETFPFPGTPSSPAKVYLCQMLASLIGIVTRGGCYVRQSSNFEWASCRSGPNQYLANQSLRLIM